MMAYFDDCFFFAKMSIFNKKKFSYYKDLISEFCYAHKHVF